MKLALGDTGLLVMGDTEPEIPITYNQVRLPVLRLEHQPDITFDLQGPSTLPEDMKAVVAQHLL